MNACQLFLTLGIVFLVIGHFGLGVVFLILAFLYRNGHL